MEVEFGLSIFFKYINYLRTELSVVFARIAWSYND